MRTSRQAVLSTAESGSEVDGPEPHSTPHRGTLAPLSICNQKNRTLEDRMPRAVENCPAENR